MLVMACERCRRSLLIVVSEGEAQPLAGASIRLSPPSRGKNRKAAGSESRAAREDALLLRAVFLAHRREQLFCRLKVCRIEALLKLLKYRLQNSASGLWLALS
jgi:hypothetical protein